MRASIIIPTYNRSDVIIRSLETWATQTLPVTDFEVIVVDNNSTDNSAKLIQTFVADKPNFYYLLETQKGSTNARHAGASMAKSGKHTFEIDEFYGDNEGLVVAEVELKYEDESYEKPHFIGQEVTGDVRYYNSSLMKTPFCRWETL